MIKMVTVGNMKPPKGVCWVQNTDDTRYPLMARCTLPKGHGGCHNWTRTIMTPRQP